MLDHNSLVTELDRLQREFDDDMRRILEGEREIGFHSIRFHQMVERHGGLGAAKRLLKSEPKEGTFGHLRNIGRQDLTVEFYVAMDKYSPLFDNDEREIARWRLDRAD